VADGSPSEGEAGPHRCYACGDAVTGVCRFCGRFFCPRHGSTGQMLCQPHNVGCLAVWVAVIGAGIAIWYFFLR